MICCVTNLNSYIDLWEYDYIKQDSIIYEMFNGDMINANNIDKYNNFDKSDIYHQYCELEVNSLDELKNLIESWEEKVIIRIPYEWECINEDIELVIVIYDGYNE